MSRFTKSICLFLAGAFLLLLGSSSALANSGVRINTTATTATSTNSVLTVLGTNGPVTVTCSSFVIRAGLGSSGAVTIASGGVTFTGCRANGVNVTITQSAAWSGTVTSLLNAARTQGTGVGLRITVPAGGVTITSAGGTFTVSGSEACLSTNTSPALPQNLGVLVNVLNITCPNTALSLITAGAGIPLLGIAAGQSANFAGLFTFSPAVNGAAI